MERTWISAKIHVNNVRWYWTKIDVQITMKT